MRTSDPGSATGSQSAITTGLQFVGVVSVGWVVGDIAIDIEVTCRESSDRVLLKETARFGVPFPVGITEAARRLWASLWVI